MFEKEAEEWWNNEYFPSLYDNVSEVWQQGAEFGYNKGYHDAEEHYMNVIDSQHKLVEKSKANEWHYVKDGDLPKEYDTVLVCTEFEQHKSCLICNYHYQKWWYSDGKYDEYVIAWKEIVLPELKEIE